MSIRTLMILLLAALVFCSCQGTKHPQFVHEPPVFEEGDEAFAGVFKCLDGKWKGEFIIFEDTARTAFRPIADEELSATYLHSLGVVEANRIQVVQEYHSESPYFQTVKIQDVYPHEGKTEFSTGINKVEKGKLSCIVNKPNETVVHQGRLVRENTIVWSRDEESPRKKEYFLETVDSLQYEIIGYGYYGDDDPTLSPRLWFYARYDKQSN